MRKVDPLADATCSKSPTWARGGVGFLIGAVVGGMIGGGVVSIMTTEFEITSPLESLKNIKLAGILATGLTVVGGLTGLVIGTRKPEC